MSAMGASEIARAFLTVQVDDRQLGPGLDKTKNTVVKSAQDMAMLASQALSALGLGAAATSALQAAAAFETTAVSLEVMLGSAEDAKALIASLNEFSLTTPFTPTEVNDAAKTLLAFGFSVDEVNDSLSFLGDISAGTGKPLQEMARILGQVRGSGFATGEDINKLIDGGFNPLMQIAERTGKSVAVLRKEMSQGKISYDMLRQSMVDATADGGLFFQMMVKQSTTFEGLISTVQGMIQGVFKGIGLKMLPMAKQLVSVAITMAQRWIEVDTAMGGSLSTITMVSGGFLLLAQTILGVTLAMRMMGLTFSTVMRGMLIASGVGIVAVALGLIVVGIQKLVGWLMSLEPVQAAVALASDKMSIAWQHLVAIWDMAGVAFNAVMGLMKTALVSIFPQLADMPDTISEGFIWMVEGVSGAVLSVVTWLRVLMENWETVLDVINGAIYVRTLEIGDYFTGTFTRIITAAQAFGSGIASIFSLVGEVIRGQLYPSEALAKLQNLVQQSAKEIHGAMTADMPESPALKAARDRLAQDVGALMDAKDALDESTQVQREEAAATDEEEVEKVAEEAEKQIKVALDDGFFGFDAFQRSFQDQLLKPNDKDKAQTEELKKGNKISEDSLAELKGMNRNLQNNKLEMASG